MLSIRSELDQSQQQLNLSSSYETIKGWGSNRRDRQKLVHFRWKSYVDQLMLRLLTIDVQYVIQQKASARASA